MQIDHTHLPVNWIDGMKISRKTFSETDAFIHEQVQDARAQQLNDFNFGIFPGEKSFDLSVLCDSNQLITAELISCKAVTPNGCRVDVTSENRVTCRANFKEILTRFGLRNAPVQHLFILLSINPFNRVPNGQPLADENPPRVPFTRPEIKLDVIPAESINPYVLGNSLILGKIIFQNNELAHQKEFIPSCVSMDSLPVLIEWHRKFRQQLDSWEQSCTRIIQKINSKTQQSNSLTQTIHKVTEKMLDKLVLQKINYQWLAGKTAPIYCCILLVENIQYIYTLISCLPEKEREELLNYFGEWADVSSGNIENITVKTLQILYNHNDIGSVLQDIQQAYTLFVLLFQKLALLDFIGKRKGQNIFVIEQEVKEIKANPGNPPEKPSRWSPLS